MQLEDINRIERQEFRNLRLSFPPVEKPEPRTKKKRRKMKTADIRRQNVRTFREGQARNYERVLLQLQATTMTSAKRRELKKMIMDLRPSMYNLRQSYMRRGDTPEHAKMIVNKDTYPFLPQISVTKNQQLRLLNELDKV